MTEITEPTDTDLVPVQISPFKAYLPHSGIFVPARLLSPRLRQPDRTANGFSAGLRLAVKPVGKGYSGMSTVK
ncbi:MAG: hypothetical protein ABI970_01655 [Chloroflexota bacterium]